MARMEPFNRCISCNDPISEHAKFCEKCGTPTIFNKKAEVVIFDTYRTLKKFLIWIEEQYPELKTYLIQ